MPYIIVFVLLFAYNAFEFKIPKQFWLILVALAITGFFAVLEPINNFDYVQYAILVTFVEAMRVFISAIKNKKYDAWIIASGFLLLFLFSLYDLLLDLNVIEPVNNIVNGYPFGFLCLIITASVYLARDFARVNRIILAQEREAREMEVSQKLLEAEHNRKAKELNEARDLQLSLLPKSKTNLENYEFCLDMRTASEVGGDYYDYQISDNGLLSVVIGDATDHGMKAGMMVSIIKSLFLTLINDMPIKEFLNKCSRTIRQMKLKNLYMALMVLKIDNQRLYVSSAGIPPLLIYRKQKNVVEEYKIKGMPLGAVELFPYEILETELDVGDTVLLMTDGLPELFNKNNESFGYDAVKEIFLQSAADPVNEIVGKLFSAGKEWLNGHKQNDDMTLIAFRLKNGNS